MREPWKAKIQSTEASQNIIMWLAPVSIRPFILLTRLDKPIGTWLLLWPGLWSLAMASPELPNIMLITLFVAGSLLMRSAGCIYNDILDRRIDANVARTQSRPLASGTISVRAAAILLCSLLIISLVILLQLNDFTKILGAASLILVFSYPLMKRITYWPQAFLGITFNWGALLGWAAATGDIASPALLLYAGGICWTLGYDTIYAHQDKEDDLRVGVKSTALLLGDKTQIYLVVFYTFSVVAFFAAGLLATISWPFYFGLGAATALLLWQIFKINLGSATDCMAKFKSNFWVGFFIFFGIIGSRLLN